MPHTAGMTRTYSTITWGLALVAAAIVLQWQQSIPWGLAAAGAVPVIAAVISLMMNEDEAAKAKAAEQRAKRVTRSNA